MKRFLLIVMKTYPRSWRDRYGGEFEALLDDTGVNGRVVFNVLCGAFMMHFHRCKEIGLAALVAMSALLSASSWIGRHPYITPGSHQVFHMDSNVGAMVGLLVLFASTIAGLPALASCIHDRSFRGGQARVLRVCTGAILFYLAALVLVSLLTPRMIVSSGDGYCWDLWCLSVEKVNGTRQGESFLYTADVRIFSNANRVTTFRNVNFVYVLDDQGRRFSVFQNSFAQPPLGATIYPKESMKTSFSFFAPANARKLYLAADELAMPWVYLYFGSDINPFHRHTLLRLW